MVEGISHGVPVVVPVSVPLPVPRGLVRSFMSHNPFQMRIRVELGDLIS